MILDSLLEFCDATSLNTGGAATYVIGSQVDLGGIGFDAGNGEPIYLVITVDTAVTGGGTVQFKLVTDSTASLATDGTSTEHWASDGFSNANLSAGRTIVVPIPSNYPTFERYMGILQVTAVAAVTAGKVNAFLTRDGTGWKAYADATN